MTSMDIFFNSFLKIMIPYHSLSGVVFIVLRPEKCLDRRFDQRIIIPHIPDHFCFSAAAQKRHEQCPLGVALTVAVGKHLEAGMLSSVL